VMHFLTERLGDKDVADLRRAIPRKDLVEAWKTWMRTRTAWPSACGQGSGHAVADMAIAGVGPSRDDSVSGDHGAQQAVRRRSRISLRSGERCSRRFRCRR